MSYQATVYRVMIASPSDVEAERRTILRVIYEWNAVHSQNLAVVLLPVMWETHATPRMGERPQAIINKQLVATCDILAGMFWTRLGTPTGKADSGTVEEIQRFVASKRPALLYFSKAPVQLNTVNFSEYERLKRFQQECYQQGLIGSYASVEEFERKIANDLMRTVHELLRVVPRDVVSRPQSSTSPQSTEERRRKTNVTHLLNALGRESRLLDERWKTSLEANKVDDARSAVRSAYGSLESELGNDLVLAHPELADMLRDIVRELLQLKDPFGIRNGAFSESEFIARGGALCKKLIEFEERAREVLEPV